MTKPRILIFQTHAENSGMQEVSRLLDAGLSARGYEVYEFYFYVRPTSFFRSAPNVILCAPPPPHGLLSRVRMGFRAIGLIRRLRPDVILCLQWGGNILGALAACFVRRPVTIANHFTAPDLMPRLARWTDWLQGTFGAFSAIVVNSRTIEKGYAAYPWRYRRRLVRIEHGFMDKTSKLTRSEARTKFQLPHNVPLLGSVGRLHASKNFAAAIRLLAHDKSWHLALCGQGRELARLRRLADELGCADRVQILGELHPDAVGDFLAAIDIFVFASNAESFGLAVVEAAQAGVPVVANDLPVLREVLAVDEGACALFVDANDSLAFARAVENLLRDDGLRQRQIELSRCLKDRYSVDRMCDGYDRLIRSALQGSPVQLLE